MRSHLHKSRFNPQSWRCLLCWILCVFVWRGPIPILHSHSLAIAELGANESLAEHAVRFHSDQLGESETGLHLHFVVLTPCEGSLLCPAVEHSHHLLPQVDLSCGETAKGLVVGLDLIELAALDGAVRASTKTLSSTGMEDSSFAISVISQTSLISSYGVALI